jgi:hypothetical protein
VAGEDNASTVPHARKQVPGMELIAGALTAAVAECMISSKDREQVSRSCVETRVLLQVSGNHYMAAMPSV